MVPGSEEPHYYTTCGGVGQNPIWLVDHSSQLRGHITLFKLRVFSPFFNPPLSLESIARIAIATVNTRFKLRSEVLLKIHIKFIDNIC
jgi:hypothetical protein